MDTLPQLGVFGQPNIFPAPLTVCAVCEDSGFHFDEHCGKADPCPACSVPSPSVAVGPSYPATPDVTPWVALVARYRRQGFHPGEPEGFEPAVGRIEARVCASLICPVCNTRGLKRRVFTDGTGYRPVSLCPTCCHAEPL